ncbi:hypothetical protein sos41_32140 [Alphaproteobacteria bacterium SO-S41]|nr:hypothetical protein sos41_32140 [Alphaproteobacteria bacterium SO-S41]
MSAQNQSPAALGLSFLNTRVVFHRSALEDSEVSVHEHFMPFGEAPPLHLHHDEDEVFHVIDGVYRVRVGDKEVIARAGDTLVAPKGVPHNFRVESEGGGHCLVITNGAGFEAFVRELSGVAVREALPVPVAPTDAQQQAMVAAGARHGIEIVGPPMAAAA